VVAQGCLAGVSVPLPRRPETGSLKDAKAQAGEAPGAQAGTVRPPYGPPPLPTRGAGRRFPSGEERALVESPFAKAIVERHLAYAARLSGLAVLEEIPSLGLTDLRAVLDHFGIALAPSQWQELKEARRGECVVYVHGPPLQAFRLSVEPLEGQERALTLTEVSNIVYRPSAWNRASNALAALTPEGAVYYVNPAWEDFFGHPRAAVLGKMAQEFPDAFSPELLRVTAKAGLKGGQRRDAPVSSRWLYRRREGGLELHVEAQLLPLLDRRTVLGYILSYRNLTQEERQGRETVLHLTTAAVAHELRNPAQAVNGFLQLAIRHAEGEIREWLEVAEQECRRMMRMLEDLLLCARAEEPRLTPVDLRQVVAEAVRTVSLHWPEAEDVVQVVGTRAVALTDFGYLTAILANLIDNALEAEGATEVTVTVAPGRIEVRDNGQGVPQDAQAHLFEPFFTTKLQGSGLGLYVAKRFADVMGATIEVHNDGGAVFTVVLDEEEGA
jgi:PAS domain S-box-containing protein